MRTFFKLNFEFYLFNDLKTSVMRSSEILSCTNLVPLNLSNVCYVNREVMGPTQLAIFEFRTISRSYEIYLISRINLKYMYYSLTFYLLSFEMSISFSFYLCFYFKSERYIRITTTLKSISSSSIPLLFDEMNISHALHCVKFVDLLYYGVIKKKIKKS